MDGIDRVEDILGIGLDWRDHAEISGIGEENVDLPPARYGGLDAPPDRVPAGDIGDDDRGPVPVETVQSGLQCVLHEVGEHHPRAFGEE